MDIYDYKEQTINALNESVIPVQDFIDAGYIERTSRNKYTLLAASLDDIPDCLASQIKVFDPYTKRITFHKRKGGR